MPLGIVRGACEAAFGGMMLEGEREQKSVFDGFFEKVDTLDHEDVYGEPHVDADEILWLIMLQWSSLVHDGLRRINGFVSDWEPSAVPAGGGGGGGAAVLALPPPPEAKEALLSCDHLTRLGMKLGLRVLTHATTDAQRDLDDVAAYQLAIQQIEGNATGGHATVGGAISKALRWRVLAGMAGSIDPVAPLRHDHERARRRLVESWAQYESHVTLFLKELVTKFSEGVGGANSAQVSERISLLQRHLEKLQHTIQQLKSGDNGIVVEKSIAEEFLGVSTMAFKKLFKQCTDAVDAGDQAPHAKLCELERMAWVEFRVLMGEVFAVQIEVAPARTRDTTEIVRDKWADGIAHSNPTNRRTSASRSTKISSAGGRH